MNDSRTGSATAPPPAASARAARHSTNHGYQQAPDIDATCYTQLRFVSGFGAQVARDRFRRNARLATTVDVTRLSSAPMAMSMGIKAAGQFAMVMNNGPI